MEKNVKPYGDDRSDVEKDASAAAADDDDEEEEV